jgi:hypothetical protein
MSPQRPVRPTQPGRQSSANMSHMRPNPQQYPSSGSVSFQPTERGDRVAPIQTRYPQHQGAAKDQPLPPTPQDLMHDPDEETAGGVFGARVARKKSLVKPDREKIEPGHRQWYYRNHAAQMENEGRVMPSSALSKTLSYLLTLISCQRLVTTPRPQISAVESHFSREKRTFPSQVSPFSSAVLRSAAGALK